MIKAKIYYARVDDAWTKQEKLGYLEKLEHIGNLEWQEITPDKKHTWLTEGLEDEFDTFISIGNREGKESGLDSETIFKNYGRGAETARDEWAYNFNIKSLSENIKTFISFYNEQVYKWSNERKTGDLVDSFVSYDEAKIKWSSRLKECLKSEIKVEFSDKKIRNSIYRPFTRQYLYFDSVLTHRRGQLPLVFPTAKSEKENQVICVTNHTQIPFLVQIVNTIPALDVGGRASQCFPFYTYDEDGTNRQENITDWSLKQFQTQYKDSKITKWDIFYYTYALLHHPHYRDRYAANLKRELPRIPFAPEFQGFAKAGKRLTEIHINYEQQPEYRLKHIENKDLPIDWRVEKMRLSKDKTQIKYNDFLTLTGIPSEALEYRLGNRSVLDWIIDQYQISTDKRSGITNDPNRLDDEEYIVRLIKQVITVSLETVKIVKSLPDLGLPQD